MKNRILIVLCAVCAVLFSCSRRPEPPEQTEQPEPTPESQTTEAQSPETGTESAGTTEPAPDGDCVRILGLILDASHPYYHNAETADGTPGTADSEAEGASAVWDAENHVLTLNGLNLTDTGSRPAVLFETEASVRLIGSDNLIRSTGGKP